MQDAAEATGDPGGFEPIRVFVVEDDLVYAEALRGVIEAEADLDCVGVTHDLASTPAEVQATRPEVVLVDLHLPDGNGLDLCQQLKEATPGLRVVVLTADDDPAVVVKAMDHGVDGFALKLHDFQVVLKKIRFVHHGSRIYDADHLA